MPNKPFTTNYRLHIPGGFVVINGEQITRITAIRHQLEEDSWEVTFFLSDGASQVIPATPWTLNFVREVFQERPDEP